ncbi:MAG: hypothetical protein LUE20_01760 [Oscillospiraceae bacterium]|nr:hypothetical protein [Oscillospiraceae bacterium]
MIKKILLILTAFALAVTMLSGCTGDMTDGDVTTKNTTVSTTERATEPTTEASTTESSVTTTDLGDGDLMETDAKDEPDISGTETPTEGIQEGS